LRNLCKSRILIALKECYTILGYFNLLIFNNLEFFELFNSGSLSRLSSIFLLLF